MITLIIRELKAMGYTVVYFCDFKQDVIIVEGDITDEARELLAKYEYMEMPHAELEKLVRENFHKNICANKAVGFEKKS